jgi:hypothetical protein
VAGAAGVVAARTTFVVFRAGFTAIDASIAFDTLFDAHHTDAITACAFHQIDSLAHRSSSSLAGLAASCGRQYLGLLWLAFREVRVARRAGVLATPSAGGSDIAALLKIVRACAKDKPVPVPNRAPRIAGCAPVRSVC